MIRIGILGLDTSHPEAFAASVADREDATVHGVWDGGEIRDAAHVEAFCEEHGARLYDEPGAMLGEVDAAMVLTVDWDAHAPLAVDFLDAGVPTLVDKPIAGNVDDVAALEDAADEASLFGGSALPFHGRFAALPRGGTDRTIYAAGYNDFFYYRVHLTDTARYLADADWAEVNVGAGPGTTADVRFENGTYATLRFDGPSDQGVFSVLDVGDAVRTAEIDGAPEGYAEMYGGFVDRFLSIVRGGGDETDRVVDSARLALAVEVALETGDSVTPASDALASVEADGGVFAADYTPYR